jgi:hypothetical protein
VGDTAETNSDKGGALAGLGLAVVLGAQVVVVLDFSIVNVALPDISSELHASSTSPRTARRRQRGGSGPDPERRRAEADRPHHGRLGPDVRPVAGDDAGMT